MTAEEQNKSKWEDLARDLGAELPDTAGVEISPADEQIASDSTETSTKTSLAEELVGRVPLPEAPPKSAPSGWDALASDLGIETPEIETAGSDVSATETTFADPSTADRSIGEEPSDPTSGAGDDAAEHGDDWAGEGTEGLEVSQESSPAEPAFGAPAGADSFDSLFGDLPDTAEAKTSGGGWDEDSQAAAEEDPNSHYGEPASTDAAPGAQIDHDPWPAPREDQGHDAATKKADDYKTDDYKTDDYEASDYEADPTDESAVADAEEDPQATLPSEPPGDDDQPPADAAASATPSRATSFWESIFGPRQSPLESRKADSPAAEEVSADVDEQPNRAGESETTTDRTGSDARGSDDDGNAGGERPARRPRRRRRGRGREEAAEATSGEAGFSSPDEDLAAAEATPRESSSGTGAGSGRTKSAKSKVPSHRNIPAWEEAVGFIVDSNLQSRDQRRRSSPRNSGRGRPRGRRKKKS